MRKVVIYTDGSYNKADKDATYGGIYMPMSGCEDMSQSVKTSVPEATSMWNVGGELLAALTAVKMVSFMAENLKDESITADIIYDYEGIGKWVTSEWKAKRTLTIAYRDYVRKMLNKHNNLKINFIWVKGHNGTSGNEMADRIAYEGMTGKRDVSNLDELINEVLGR